MNVKQYDRLRPFFIILITAVLLFAAALVFQIVRCRTCFCPSTSVSGADCGGLTPAQAARRVNDAASSKTITLTDEDGGVIGTFNAALLLPEDIELRLQALHQQQRHGSGIASIFGLKKYTYTAPWLDAQAVKAVILSVSGDYGYTEAVDSGLEVTDAGWVVTQTVDGTAPDADLCAGALLEQLMSPDTFSPTSLDCSVSLPLTRLDPADSANHEANQALLQRQLEQLDEVQKLDITVDFGAGITARLTPAQIAGMLNVSPTDTGVRITTDKKKTADVLSALAEELGADGIARKYAAIDRDELHYNDWDTGYTLDSEGTAQEIIKLLAARKSGKVDAQYDYTSSADAAFGLTEEFGYGNTFIEISIENQFMWYYKDGQLLVATPVVTGDVDSGNITRTGVFRVEHMWRTCYLRGAGYSYFVNYWMPFDGNIGIHDAPWVTEFGTDKYLTDGSHGCVNTPFEAAQTIYENCEYYYPVIVY